MANNRKKLTPARSQRFVSVLSPNTPFAYVEAFKALRTNLSFLSGASGVKSILITSAMPEESKSTTAINLAVTLAASGKHVVLVESDLRKPILQKYLKLDPGKPGLAGFLAGVCGLDECLTEAPELGISVIPAGIVPPNPSELLNSERMYDLLETLKRNYDYVLLDAPPVTVVTDAAVVGRMTDGAILVVRSKFAHTRTIRQAKSRLAAVGIPILGGVLTRFDLKNPGWRGGYDLSRYDYGYGQSRGRR